MNAELRRFFDSINFTKVEEFLEAEIEKVILKKSEELFEVYIKSNKMISLSIIKSLFSCANQGINGQKKCKIFMIYPIINLEDVKTYVSLLIQDIIKRKPSLTNLDQSNVEINENMITIDVANKIEEDIFYEEGKKLEELLFLYGLGTFKVKTNINEEIKACIKEEIENSKMAEFAPIQSQRIEGNSILGKHREGEPTPINNIIGDTKNIIIEAYIFGIETMERETINIITLKISDFSNSLLAKIFKKDKNEYKAISSSIKQGEWYRFSGNVEFDNFSKDYVLAIRSIEKITSKAERKEDNAEIKRVELHTHTMMSAMDGVIPAKDLVTFASKMGYKAFAITDHNCAQSFPDIYNATKKLNKGKDPEDRLKVLYGAEMNVINDDVDIIFNNEEYNLLEQTYVVFDTETTGFYAGSDQMIEIGAVKIKNGEIIDRFDELIDPKRPIPKKITELTFITDEMVKGKRSEKEVTKDFLAWSDGLPMIAHNAKFDIGFMNAACQKYNLGDFNRTVIDTMGLARYLNPEWANHKLQTLTKKYNIEWDEDKHHRADYDSEGTALAYYQMAKTLYDRNIETTRALIDSIDIISLLKFSFPFHATIIAKNKVGLKNLYKIISFANTKYLYKNDQPKIPRKEVQKLREGILIGSGCVNGEIFKNAALKEDEELVNMMNFYDYIEVQPPIACMHLIGENQQFKSIIELQNHIKRIIEIGGLAGIPVVATSDAHHLTKEDKIYREIIINQKFAGKFHPLNRKGITIPDMHYLTTEEMLEQFSFIDENTRQEIVIDNPIKIAKEIEEFEVILDPPAPFSPKIDDCDKIVTNMVYEKANEWYGDSLPHLIEDRIALELYGEGIFKAIRYDLDEKQITKENNEYDNIFYDALHQELLHGLDHVKKKIIEFLKKTNDHDLTDSEINAEVKKNLGGIIGAGFDVIYLISQKLVKHSNDEGYLVGSRGSVGSSFVATMMGITEVNPLAAHYRCPNCKQTIFEIDDIPLGKDYSSGFDLPDKKCPNCNEFMIKDGQDMPFATFLGFNADKVPDIDLNFSDLNQASAHDYTKKLFGVDNVYRAGTIGTVAEKTAFGYVKGYCENKNIMLRNAEIERLAKGCTGVKRTTGQHPGGIVVIPGYMDVYDFVPYQFPAEDPSSSWRTTHFDYHAIDSNLLKLDILGHSDPTQLRLIQDISGDDITKVPLDDKKTMSIFTSPKALGVTSEQIMCDVGTLGIPEFGTPFTLQMVKDTKPKSFADLIKISGLSHGTDVWLGNAQELIQKNIVPFSEVIGCRDDIMVYLMYKGVEPIKAFKIMEFVRKGRPSREPEAWQEFVEIMKEAKIEDWYIKSCQKIKYMFPKAHAAAYVTSAFRIAYYKVHKPIIYYASWFSTKAKDFDMETMIQGYDAIKKRILDLKAKGYDITNKEADQIESLQLALEATARGIIFGNFDIEKSDANYFKISEDNTILIPPFRALEGLGEQVAKKIIEEREIKPFYSVEDFQIRGKVNQTTIEKLRSLGIFEGMPETSQLSLF